MSDFEENDDFMCDDEEDYGLVRKLLENPMPVYYLTHRTFFHRNIQKIAILSRMLILKINTTIAKH